MHPLNSLKLQVSTNFVKTRLSSNKGGEGWGRWVGGYYLLEEPFISDKSNPQFFPLVKGSFFIYFEGGVGS